MKEIVSFRLLLQLAFDLCNEFLTPPVHLILRVE